MIAITASMLALAVLFFPGRGKLYLAMHAGIHPGFDAYFQEGVDGLVMTYQKDYRAFNYINGSMHGGRPGAIYLLQSLQAISAAASTENILVIGFGTGSSADAMLCAPGIKKLTVVEINRTLIANLEKMPLFQKTFSDPRLNLVIDDGRRFLLHAAEHYDLVAMDPLRSTTALSNNIYSREFFELVSKRLRPGGVFLVWTDEARVIPKTLASVFPCVVMYETDGDNRFLLASDQPLYWHSQRWNQALAELDKQEPYNIVPSMHLTPVTPMADRSSILMISEKYPINRDLRPVSEYYLGLKMRERLRRSE